MADSLFDKFPRPPCAELLGLTLLDHNPAERWARFSFEGRQEFLNPAGFIQGGILSAMLDDTMGPTALLVSGGTLYTDDQYQRQFLSARETRPAPIRGSSPQHG